MERLVKLETFLAQVRYIDRVRGYPTGREWNEIIKQARALEKEADQILFDEAQDEFRYLYLGQSQKAFD